MAANFHMLIQDEKEIFPYATLHAKKFICSTIQLCVSTDSELLKIANTERFNKFICYNIERNIQTID